MEKKITQLLRCLKVEFALLWALCIILIVLYECDILPQGVLTDDARTGYMLQVLGILLAVGLIPLSLRLFSLSLTKYVRTLPLLEALKSYRCWNEVRVCLLLVAALVNLSVYYWTMDTTGLLCAGMVLVASLFCIPGRERMMAELDLRNNEERV